MADIRLSKTFALAAKLFGIDVKSKSEQSDKIIYNCPFCSGGDREQKGTIGYVNNSEHINISCWKNCIGNHGIYNYIKEHHPQSLPELQEILFGDKKRDIIRQYQANIIPSVPKSIKISTENTTRLKYNIHGNWFVSVMTQPETEEQEDIKEQITEYIRKRRIPGDMCRKLYMGKMFDRIGLLVPYGDDPNMWFIRWLDDDGGQKCKFPKGVKMGDNLYIPRKLDLSKPVYVVEGQIDAMFIHNSVSIGGTNRYKLFPDRWQELGYQSRHELLKNTIMLADNDNAGMKATQYYMIDNMISQVKTCVWWAFPKDIKDINDIVVSGKYQKYMNNDGTLNPAIFHVENNRIVFQKYLEWWYARNKQEESK